MTLKYGPIALHNKRWSAIGAPLASDPAAGVPGAALQQPRERQLRGTGTQANAQLRCDPIQQRYGQRAPLDDCRVAHWKWCRRQGWVAQCKDAEIDEQAPVAVLRKPGQVV